jgi:CDP-glycerol glycerophosphotransferase (TagB/SpsB family)
VKYLLIVIKIIFAIINIPIRLISELIPKQKDIWIFGAWYGNKYNDNSKELFEYVNSRFPGIKTIWFSRSHSIVKNLTSNGYRAVTFYSLKGYYYSVVAGKVIVSSSTLTDINKYAISSKTKKILLWHGIPIKKIGSNAVRKKVGLYQLSDLIKEIVFPYYTEYYDMITTTSVSNQAIFRNSFQSKSFVITGYPRNDKLFHTRSLSELNRKIILYAPTYRGEVGDYFDPFTNYGFDAYKLDELLEKYSSTLYIRYHYASAVPIQIQNMIESRKNIYFDFADSITLVDVDLLISDYSGIYLDFLLLLRPVIFYAFDEKDYCMTSGLLYDYNEITPGPIVYNWKDLMTNVELYLIDPTLFEEDRKLVRDMFHTFQDGLSSQRVVDELFKLDLNS